MTLDWVRLVHAWVSRHGDTKAKTVQGKDP
jgi:hypothetical protein